MDQLAREKKVTDANNAAQKELGIHFQADDIMDEEQVQLDDSSSDDE